MPMKLLMGPQNQLRLEYDTHDGFSSFNDPSRYDIVNVGDLKDLRLYLNIFQQLSKFKLNSFRQFRVVLLSILSRKYCLSRRAT